MTNKLALTHSARAPSRASSVHGTGAVIEGQRNRTNSVAARRGCSRSGAGAEGETSEAVRGDLLVGSVVLLVVAVDDLEQLPGTTTKRRSMVTATMSNDQMVRMDAKT